MEIAPTTMIVMNEHYTVFPDYEEIKQIFISSYNKNPTEKDIKIIWKYIPVLYIGEDIHINIQKNSTTKNSKIKLNSPLKLTQIKRTSLSYENSYESQIHSDAFSSESFLEE